MIVEALLSIVFGLVNLILSVFSLLPIPAMPESLVKIGNTIIVYLKDGLSFVMFFFNRPLLLTCLSITLIAHHTGHLYSVFKWILSKFGMNFD